MKAITTSESTQHSSTLVQEAIYREHFLKNALRRVNNESPSIAVKDFDSLLEDIEQNQEILHSCSNASLYPALAAITSREARNWEQQLNETLSDTDCRWEKVFRVTYELSCIADLLNRITSENAELEPLFHDHLVRLQAHETFHEKVLYRWLQSERERGNPVDDLIASKTAEVDDQWKRVLSELLPRERSKMLIPADSWRSVERVVSGLLQSLRFPHSGNEHPKAAA